MYLPEPARQRRPRSELEHGLRSCSGGTSTSRHLAERHPQVLIIALGDLVLAIATINVWNRLAISTRMDA